MSLEDLAVGEGVLPFHCMGDVSSCLGPSFPSERLEQGLGGIGIDRRGTRIRAVGVVRLDGAKPLEVDLASFGPYGEPM